MTDAFVDTHPEMGNLDACALMPSDEISKLGELLLGSCGNGKLLHIGRSDLGIVQFFLSRGVQVVNSWTESERINAGNVQIRDHFITWDGARLPFTDAEFSTVLVTDGPTPGMLDSALIAEVLRVAAHHVFLYLEAPKGVQAKDFRKTCEAQFFQADARKHPAYYRVNDYQSLQEEHGRVSIPLEKLPSAAAEQFPLSALVEERDLHMDMTREPGSRSDAHIVRYMLASRYVRPGDRVLDAACGLGYGAYTLAQCSDAKSVQGIDGSAYAIRYATLNFTAKSTEMSFREGWLPEAIAEIPDNSIDLITSFETLEHVQDPQALLAEFYRVLTPAGRIILSVPNDWSDETGEDPNPFHFHVYTWSKIIEESKKHFLIEAAFAQTADQYKKNKQWAVGTRQLNPVNVDDLSSTDPECEWCLLVGMKDPLLGTHVPYIETTYETYPENPDWHATRFDDYQNPWLVKGLVSIGHRLTNAQLLTSLAEQVCKTAPAHSPDLGAGLCITGYRLYEATGTSHAQVKQFETLCRAFLTSRTLSPQQLRWQVSLNYLLGHLLVKWGETDLAIRHYQDCAEMDCTQYSSTLMTKQVQAYRALGLIESGRGNTQAAADYWRLAIKVAEQALSLDWTSAIGSGQAPNDFGLHELGAIVECASSCACALNHIHDAETKTPQWWHQFSRDRVSQLGRMSEMQAEIGRLNHYIFSKESNFNSALTASHKEALEQQALHHQFGLELSRLNSMIASKDKLLSSTGEELNRLNQIVAEKDSALSALGLEEHRLNVVIVNKDQQLNELGRQIEALHQWMDAHSTVQGAKDPMTSRNYAELNGEAFASFLRDDAAHLLEELKNLRAAGESQMAEQRNLEAQIVELQSQLREKDTALNALEFQAGQQLQALQHAFDDWRANSASADEHRQLQHQLDQISLAHREEVSNHNRLRNTRLIRWRDAVAARPLTLRGVARIAFLSGSLLTPGPLRNALRPSAAKLIERLRAQRVKAAAVEHASSPETGYLVKQPTRPEPNRPVIVHVIANFMTGGSSRLVVDIFEYLGNQYDQRVVTSLAPQPAAYVGIPIEEIRFPNDEAPFVALFEKLQPDFIHMHYWGDCDEPWYAKAVRAAERLGIQVIENINTPVAPFYSEAISRYVYVSDYVKRVFGKPEQHHVTVYPGSDFSMFESKSRRKASHDCIGMVYRLENDKLNSESIMPFILAVQKKPSIKVVIVGGGTLLEEFTRTVAEAGLSGNFEFTGYVSYDALPAIYERMNIFVAPVWKESFGQVSPFAMNMRVPVVGFDVGAIGEIVEDPTLLAPAGNSEALANIIVSLLNDNSRRKKIAEQHRQRAQDHFSVQAMIKGYQDIYRDTMVNKIK